jgi:hypothetical protein
MQTDIFVNLPWKQLVENFVRFACVELDIQPKSLVIAKYDVVDDTLGLCIDDTTEDYIILVHTADRDIGQIFVTIAHELIHVKQYMKENLGWFMDNQSQHIPYMERWWEQEAFKWSVPLVEKFAKGLNK